MDKNQEKLMQKLGMYEQQIMQLQQQLESVEQAIVEMNSLVIGLDELIGSKEKEILAPIGRGIFVKTKLASEELTVDVGGKNLVKKSIPETKKLIEDQIVKLDEVKKELNSNLESINNELTTTFMNAQGEHVHDENCEHKH
ncbi:prefoldin subunit alpha [Candidatus Pacearchaeota archaeon]|nr:prefoldin subunit alpha [Candidatus Pacearchaeota archaeon]